ncbi:MAG TPA: aminotransferase class III-fold pyridoxal phosphate-dependent enzyme [Acidimicrobiia bacterium]|nr:aminotransferase class III-fold pyridoxal phosphate-dependent enzyme [Acidimicrobiia bacterium]
MSNSIVERHEKVYAPVIAWDSDLEIVSGQGSWVTDIEGERYLDFATGISVINAGHNHPDILAAARDQLDRLWHAGGAFRYDSLVTAAEKVVAVTPDPIEKLFFMNSGAEAVEASIKLARKTTGRQGVMVFRGAFHGRTMGSVTYTTSKAKYRQGYHPLLPSVFVTPFPHPFGWGMSEDEATDYAIRELDMKFAHEVTPGEVAALLVEPIQGEGGYYPAPARFLQRLRDLADEHGILLIFDEIQTGFGRTSKWFASDHYEVDPDVLLMGKAIANGLPLSAVGASAEILDAWAPGSHGTTFGGNAVSCAAAAATVDVLGTMIPGTGALSEQAFARFADLKSKHPTIGDVRGTGLMIGVELVTEGNTPDPEAFPFLAQHCRDESRLLILDCGPNANIIRFIPPLCVTGEELDQGIDAIDAALTAYESR